ncbi:hypothetical protein D6C79_10649 [Aureobasidium pullulans]|nr:hypothetical protein D6C79_10649 [Aureobasidium pullulans]
MIELCYGIDSEIRTMVHKSLLYFYSPYYRALLEGGFPETGQKSVDTHLDDATGSMFVSWLYSGQMLPYTELSHFELYVFADKTENLALRRSIMTVVVQGSQRQFSELSPILDDLKQPLTELPSTSPLFQWILNTFVHHWDPTEYPPPDEALLKEIPADFFLKVAQEIALKFKNNFTGPCPCCHNYCNYHEHESVAEWHMTCDYHCRPSKEVVPMVEPDEEFLKPPVNTSSSSNT